MLYSYSLWVIMDRFIESNALAELYSVAAIRVDCDAGCRTQPNI